MDPHKRKSKGLDMEGESVRKIAVNHRARIVDYTGYQFCCVLKRMLKRINMLPFKNVGLAPPAVNLSARSPPTRLHRSRIDRGLLL